MLAYRNYLNKVLGDLSKESARRHRFQGQIVLVNYGKAVSYTQDGQQKVFTTTGKGIRFVEVQFMQLNEYLTTEEAIEKIHKMGYRPALAQELRRVTPISVNPVFMAALGSVQKNEDGEEERLCLLVNGKELRFEAWPSARLWAPYTMVAMVLK